MIGSQPLTIGWLRHELKLQEPILKVSNNQNQPMDTTYLEDQIKQFETVVEDRQKKMDFMKRQQKEDKDILKQMKKSLQRLKDGD